MISVGKNLRALVLPTLVQGVSPLDPLPLLCSRSKLGNHKIRWTFLTQNAVFRRSHYQAIAIVDGEMNY